MVEPINLRVNGSSTWLKDASTQMVTVSNSGNAATTKVMYSSYTGAWSQFQVPAGSKFIPLVIQFQSQNTGAATGNGDIQLSDGAAGVAGTTKWECQMGVENARDVFSSFDVYLDNFAAGEHVNATIDSTAYWGISITGILTTV